MNREFSPKVRAEVTERSNGVCEVCRLLPIEHFHHRLRKSQGGRGTADNCLGLDHLCHAFIHDNPADSYDMGWLLHPAPVNMGLKS